MSSILHKAKQPSRPRSDVQDSLILKRKFGQPDELGAIVKRLLEAFVTPDIPWSGAVVKPLHHSLAFGKHASFAAGDHRKR